MFLLCRIDSNKDGSLVVSEMKAFSDAMKSASLEKLFAMADLNDDKKVSQDEFSKFLTTLLRVTFDRVVRNRTFSLHASHLATFAAG